MITILAKANTKSVYAVRFIISARYDDMLVSCLEWVVVKVLFGVGCRQGFVISRFVPSYNRIRTQSIYSFRTHIREYK